MKTTMTHAKDRLLGAYVDLKMAIHLVKMVQATRISSTSRVELGEMIGTIESIAGDVQRVVDMFPVEIAPDVG